MTELWEVFPDNWIKLSAQMATGDRVEWLKDVLQNHVCNCLLCKLPQFCGVGQALWEAMEEIANTQQAMSFRLKDTLP